jgi:hypothetical protein
VTFVLPANAPQSKLAAAVEDNLTALTHVITTLPNGEWIETPTHTLYHTPYTSPFFKGVVNTHLSAVDVEAAIEQVMAWFKERRAPYYRWWFSSHTEPADLKDRLVAHGFSIQFDNDPGMIADLTALDAAFSPPPDVDVFRVQTADQLVQWRDVLHNSIGMPAASAQAWIDATLAMGLDHPSWRVYLATLNGIPAATSLVFDGGGTAGIYAVGTLSPARGKGLGGAVTLKAMFDSRDAGYENSVLFSSPLGYSVYRRIGFRDANFRIGRCLWMG